MQAPKNSYQGDRVILKSINFDRTIISIIRCFSILLLGLIVPSCSIIAPIDRTIDEVNNSFLVLAGFQQLEDAIDIGIILGSKSFIGNGDLATQAEPESIPVYGNWCGPAYPEKGLEPNTVDTLDRICQSHDMCYVEKGMFNCDCDRKFVEEVSSSLEQLTGYEQSTAYTFGRYFVRSDCSGGSAKTEEWRNNQLGRERKSLWRLPNLRVY